MLTKRILSCLVVLVFNVSFIWAGDVTFFAGYQNPGKVSREMVVDNISKVFSADAAGGVVGIRYSGNRPVTFESGFSYGPKFLTSDQKFLQINTNLLAQFPGHISPYGTAGIGLLSTWGGTSGGNGLNLPIIGSLFNFGTRFAFNYGGGVKLRNLAGPFGLRFDIRGYSAPGVYGSTLNIFEMSAGAMISW
jgi:hypothetical protein